MRCVQHPTNNRVLGAPTGWSQEELRCNAIPITDVDLDGTPVVVTYWRPTEEELAAMNRGEYVQLSIIGRTMPPVAILVGP